MSKDEVRVLALVSEMKRALETATTLEDVTRVRNEAEAVRCLVQKAKLGLKMHNEAAEFKLRAERKAGEMLSAAAKPGRRTNGKTYHDGTFKLGELGITRNQSSRWQREAAVPDSIFEAYLREARQAEREVSAAELLRRSAVTSLPRRAKPLTVSARREGKAFVVELMPAQAATRNAGTTSVKELLAEAKNHRALLASILLPYCERQQQLEPAARRHAARLLHDLEAVLDQAECLVR